MEYPINRGRHPRSLVLKPDYAGITMWNDDVIKWNYFSALLALCAGNSSVTGEFPTERPVMRNFDVSFDLWMKGWASNREPGDLRRHRAHYDVSVLSCTQLTKRQDVLPPNFVRTRIQVKIVWSLCNLTGVSVTVFPSWNIDYNLIVIVIEFQNFIIMLARIEGS